MILFLDCANGAAGDMLAAALVDMADRLGIDGEAVVREALAAAGIDPGAVAIKPTSRAGFAARRFVVEDRPGFSSFDSLTKAVSSSSLPRPVVERVVAVADRMAAAERRVHADTGEHLHELSSLDTAVDLIAVASLLHALCPGSVVASPPSLGGGIIDSAHGRLAVPAPAVVVLLEGLPTAGGTSADAGELTTPTGAALLAEIVDLFGPLPAGRLLASGTGAGMRDTPGAPNVLRAFAIEDSARSDGDAHGGAIELLEATIDDATAEVLAAAAEEVRAAGALDVWLTPAFMKKGRSGHVFHALIRAADRGKLAEAVFRHTTTFGLRVLPVDRVLLQERRESVTVDGTVVRVRLGYLDGQLVTASPEFEDCRRLAAEGSRPLKAVFAAAQAAAFGRFGAA